MDGFEIVRQFRSWEREKINKLRNSFCVIRSEISSISDDEEMLKTAINLASNSFRIQYLASTAFYDESSRKKGEESSRFKNDESSRNKSEELVFTKNADPIVDDEVEKVIDTKVDVEEHTDLIDRSIPLHSDNLPDSRAHKKRRSLDASFYCHQFIIGIKIILLLLLYALRIGMTNENDEFIKQKALQAGVDCVLVKPFTLNKFISTINESKTC